MTFSTASMGEIDCATIAIALFGCLAVSRQAISTILSVLAQVKPAKNLAPLGDDMKVTASM